MNIRVKITRDGSNAVKTTEMEEYLRGVVPSEMPSSWPAEALKAQAIAARTYAMTRLRPEELYDVDDTTANQAYRRNYTKESTDAAVTATAGRVLRYGGRLAQAVYCASNGGKTVSAKARWGNDVAYLPARSDPYDAAAGVKKNGHGVGMSQHGARQMAMQGKTCEEILAWYYPGCTIGGEAAEPVETVVLRVSTKADPLNVRSSPGMESAVLAKAPKGAPLLGREYVDGWRHVGLFVDGGKMVEGWAKDAYLKGVEE